MQGGFDFFPSDTGLAILIGWSGILIVPLILGVRLLRKAGQGEWHRMAALLTMMPILTGPLFWIFPIFLFFLLGIDIDAASLIKALGAVLPGVVLTCLIAIRFRRCFSGSTTLTAWFLLILACARWLNSFMIGAAPVLGIDSGPFLMIGIALPTVFAIVASYVSSKVSRARVERST